MCLLYFEFQCCQDSSPNECTSMCNTRSECSFWGDAIFFSWNTKWSALTQIYIQQLSWEGDSSQWILAVQTLGNKPWLHWDLDQSAIEPRRTLGMAVYGNLINNLAPLYSTSFFLQIIIIKLMSIFLGIDIRIQHIQTPIICIGERLTTKHIHSSAAYVTSVTELAIHAFRSTQNCAPVVLKPNCHVHNHHLCAYYPLQPTGTPSDVIESWLPR